MKIIAEIGFNHEGDIEEGKRLIAAAAGSGADAVKFQTFRASDLVPETSEHFKLIKNAEMTFDDHLKLDKTAKSCGIEFLSTPFSPWAVDLLEKIGVKAYKIASMDCTNRYLLKHVAQTKKPLYISTGMANFGEIAETLDYLTNIGSGPVTLFHCLSIYPAKMEELNLETIKVLKDLFGLPVGYSDHYPGSAACLAAAMVGAEVIETHFTLDSSKKGGDHYHSVTPAEMKKLKNDIDSFLTMKGERNAAYSRADRKNAKDFRRGVYAAKDIVEGKVIAPDDLAFIRPANFFSPNDLDVLVGRRIKRNLQSYDPIIPDSII